jgi:hypothetical protein
MNPNGGKMKKVSLGTQFVERAALGEKECLPRHQHSTNFF